MEHSHLFSFIPQYIWLTQYHDTECWIAGGMMSSQYRSEVC